MILCEVFLFVVALPALLFLTVAPVGNTGVLTVNLVERIMTDLARAERSALLPGHLILWPNRPVAVFAEIRHQSSFCPNVIMRSPPYLLIMSTVIIFSRFSLM